MKPVIVTNLVLHFDINDNVKDVGELTNTLIKKINKELHKFKDTQPQISIGDNPEIKVIDLF